MARVELGALLYSSSFSLDKQQSVVLAVLQAPGSNALDLQSRVKAKMDEPVLPEDPTSNQKDEQLPTYNAYSIDGDVTGPLVYVNYGVPEDYEELERRGVVAALDASNRVAEWAYGQTDAAGGLTWLRADEMVPLDHKWRGLLG